MQVPTEPETQKLEKQSQEEPPMNSTLAPPAPQCETFWVSKGWSIPLLS